MQTDCYKGENSIWTVTFIARLTRNEPLRFTPHIFSPFARALVARQEMTYPVAWWVGKKNPNIPLLCRALRTRKCLLWLSWKLVTNQNYIHTHIHTTPQAFAAQEYPRLVRGSSHLGWRQSVKLFYHSITVYSSEYKDLFLGTNQRTTSLGKTYFNDKDKKKLKLRCNGSCDTRSLPNFPNPTPGIRLHVVTGGEG